VHGFQQLSKTKLGIFTLQNKYNGGDQIHTVNGAGMNISHIDHTIVRTPNRNIHLKNVLYVP
jgi:hypothetical protein